MFLLFHIICIFDLYYIKMIFYHCLFSNLHIVCHVLISELYQASEGSWNDILVQKLVGVVENNRNLLGCDS